MCMLLAADLQAQKRSHKAIMLELISCRTIEATTGWVWAESDLDSPPVG